LAPANPARAPARASNPPRAVARARPALAQCATLERIIPVCKHLVQRGDGDVHMKQGLGLVSLVVREYDEALEFFVGKLGFVLVEDSFVQEQAKRWVVVAPPGAVESRLLLARAASPEQASRVGSQTGGRVFLFLYTDDFWRDFARYQARGVAFVRPPKQEPYGIVAVFKDLYGNLWDLLQPNEW
jgi:catechol 2,3-dioxygenase-like lactoylglutathione lyase family enzyme